MKVLTPRHSFSLDYTPKQWVSFSNTFILFLVAFMCGTVVYEVYNINQRFTNGLDSSAADIQAANFIDSKIQPSWKDVNSNISVYSSFFKIQDGDESMVLIIGSTSESEVQVEDFRCLMKYVNEEDLRMVEASFEKFSSCTTFFVFCPTEGNSIPKKVVLISNRGFDSDKWVEIETVSSRRESDLVKRPKTAACVKPLSETVSVETLQEFVDFYEAIGLSHFYFYEYNAQETITDFIHDLAENDHSINILPWNKKAERSNSCPFSGQEYVQDCLQRALGKYTNVLTVDVTDYFILGQHTNINDLLENYSSYEQLQIKKAPYCNTGNQNAADLTMKNMHFLAPIDPSETNYIFRPDTKAAIEFYAPSPKKEIHFSEVLSEYEGVIGDLQDNCE